MFILENKILVDLAFLSLSTLIVLFAILAVRLKEHVYSAISLGVVGICVAAVIGLIGFGYIAAFHLLVYVGATVTFVVFTVITLRPAPVFLKGVKVVAAVNSMLLALIVYYFISNLGLSSLTIPKLDLSEATKLILEKYWYPLFLVVVSLITLMIGGIVIARGEENGG